MAVIVAFSMVAVSTSMGLGAESAEAAHKYRRADGDTHCAVAIMFLIDRSGSMALNNELTYAKAGMDNFLSILSSDQYRSGLVSYGDTATLDASLSNIHAETRTAVSQLTAGGGQDTLAGISLAHEALVSQRGNEREALILLTDEDLDFEWTQTALQAVKNDGIEVFGVSISNGYVSPVVSDPPSKYARHAGNPQSIEILLEDLLEEIQEPWCCEQSSPPWDFWVDVSAVPSSVAVPERLVARLDWEPQGSGGSYTILIWTPAGGPTGTSTLVTTTGTSYVHDPNPAYAHYTYQVRHGSSESNKINYNLDSELWKTTGGGQEVPPWRTQQDVNEMASFSNYLFVAAGEADLPISIYSQYNGTLLAEIPFPGVAIQSVDVRGRVTPSGSIDVIAAGVSGVGPSGTTDGVASYIVLDRDLNVIWRDDSTFLSALNDETAKARWKPGYKCGVVAIGGGDLISPRHTFVRLFVIKQGQPVQLVDRYDFGFANSYISALELDQETPRGTPTMYLVLDGELHAWNEEFQYLYSLGGGFADVAVDPGRPGDLHAVRHTASSAPRRAFQAPGGGSDAEYVWLTAGGTIPVVVSPFGGPGNEFGVAIDISPSRQVALGAVVSETPLELESWTTSGRPGSYNQPFVGGWPQQGSTIDWVVGAIDLNGVSPSNFNAPVVSYSTYVGGIGPADVINEIHYQSGGKLWAGGFIYYATGTVGVERPLPTTLSDQWIQSFGRVSTL